MLALSSGARRQQGRPPSERVGDGAEAGPGDSLTPFDESGGGRGLRPSLRHGALLRIPPFPGARPGPLARRSSSVSSVDRQASSDIITAMRSARVGGTYWAAQPPLPVAKYTLVRTSDCTRTAERLAKIEPDRPSLCWLTQSQSSPSRAGASIAFVRGSCDCWYLLTNASSIVVDRVDELALLAHIAGIPVRFCGGDFGRADDLELDRLVESAIQGFDYFSPYTGEPITALEAVSLCAFWRDLIDRNRILSGAAGLAFWKRSTIAPLLWPNVAALASRRDCKSVKRGDVVAIWKSRAPAAVLIELERRGAKLIEVEDGFIRSSGLGADCVPPLSIVVDRLGVHFDPERPSELENLLETGDFSEALLNRARQLRESIVRSRLSKYGVGKPETVGVASGRRSILVPGQVEDDLAVIRGGRGLTSNLELLRRVREGAPEAFIIYKPHPDVVAGHRRGAIPDEKCSTVADKIVRGGSISSLIDSVDEVHVNTSLTGFEALLRHKPVTTYGVPFYAGWGLTCDRGAVPDRRTAKRSLDELVAAVLLLYPRYLDPVTGLPCPPEVLVRRLIEISDRRRSGWLVKLRRLQGRLRRGLNAVHAAVVQ